MGKLIKEDKNKFKYDYNNKIFIINIILSFLFFLLSIIVFENLIGFILLLSMAILSVSNSFFLIWPQGIRIAKNSIVIVDDIRIKKINMDDIKYLTFKQIPKEKKNNFYGFFLEFFIPYTYMTHCDYVYNQGKVFNIYIYLKNGTIITSYYGWLYKEKKIEKVMEIERKLNIFIKKVNSLCRKNDV